MMKECEQCSEEREVLGGELSDFTVGVHFFVLKIPGGAHLNTDTCHREAPTGQGLGVEVHPHSYCREFGGSRRRWHEIVWHIGL